MRFGSSSINSFSRGNPVPATCMVSGKVTMIGQTSGGGSCVVLPCATASGALLQICGPKQLSIVKNGGFYDIDTGVEPDVLLTRAETFHDRPTLAGYLYKIRPNPIIAQ